MVFVLYLPKLNNTYIMSARKRILNIARDKGINTTILANKVGYEFIQSFYRGLNNPDQISYGKIKKLAKELGMDVCDVIKIIK